jgi:ribosomal-protein-alanine N-acetyltransferase
LIDLLIRAAEAADACAIAEMEALLFSDAWSEGSVSSSISSPLSLAFVAVCEGKAVGYLLASALAPEGELLRIGVCPEYRKRGIGGALMERFLLKSESLLCDTLFLEVRADNAPAISLYRRYGFFDCGVRKKYYKNPECDALLMKKEKTL